jgi:hypothetical protein
MRLDDADWVRHASKSVGDVRINHNSVHCSGSSRSLVISRLPDGTLSAKCFRCGKWGRKSPDNYVPPTAVPKRTYKPIPFPPDCTTWDMFPADVKLWLLSGGLSKPTVDKCGVVWSPSRNTLIVPVAHDGILVGAVHRGFFGEQRYRLYTNDSDECFLMYSRKSKRQVVVLCEDFVSCIRLTEVGYTGIALLGVSLRKGVRSMLSELDPEHVVVWLDNDNTNVKRAATSIAKELSSFNARVVRNHSDPKKYTNEELKRIVWNLLY